MKINIQKLLLNLIFPISVFIDLINGFCQFRLGISLPIGVLLRTFIIFLLFYSIQSVPSILGKRYLKFIIVVYVFCMLLWMIRDLTTIQAAAFSVGIEINAFIRVIYLCLLIVYMSYFATDIKDIIEPIIVNYGFIIGLCIIFSFVTGFGQNSYGENYGFGTKSFFIAGNDIGITLLYSGVVTSIHLFSHYKTINFIKFITIIAGCVLIGSRVGMLGAGLLLSLTMGYYIFFYKPVQKRAKIYKKLVTYILIPIAIYGLVQIVMLLISVFDQYTLDRMSLDSIGSARDNLISCADRYIATLEGLSWAIGNGRSVFAGILAQYMQTGLETKIAEADYHDMVGSYGYLYGWILMIPYVIFVVQSVKQYFRQPSYYNCCLVFICITFIFIGYNAGHCIANVMVAPIYAYAISQIATTRNMINLISVNRQDENIGDI